MKNILQEYIPFEHENANYINSLIAFARDQRKKGTTESALATTVVYANLVEYLAGHLVTNIKHMIHLLSYFSMKGVLFPKSGSNKDRNKPLSQLKDELVKYEFPDSQSFIQLVGLFNGARNRLLHNLMNAKNDTEVKKLDADIVEIQRLAEEILQQYNVIIQGVQSIWKENTSVTTDAAVGDKDKKSTND